MLCLARSLAIAHVFEPELAGDLRHGIQVALQGIRLLGFVAFGTFATVDVDHVQSFGVFDDQIGAAFEDDGAPEELFDLFGDVELIEDGDVPLVHFDDLLGFGFDGRDIFFHLVEDLFVVHVDVGEGVVEQVAEDGGRAALFAQEQVGRLSLLQGREDAFPFGDQADDVGLDVFGRFSFGGRTDNGTVVAGQDPFDDGLEASFLLVGSDLLRYVHLVGEGDQHQMASGDGDIAGDAGSLGRDRLFGNLDNDVLSAGEYVGDFAFFTQIVLETEGGEIDLLMFSVDLLDDFVQGWECASEVEVVQEGILLVPDIDESGVQPSHHFMDSPEVDIADGERALGFLPVEFHELAVFQQGDVNLGACGVDY